MHDGRQLPGTLSRKGTEPVKKSQRSKRKLNVFFFRGVGGGRELKVSVLFRKKKKSGDVQRKAQLKLCTAYCANRS